MSSSAGLLVIWDFDWTLINENSDTYVIEQCGGAGATAKMKALTGLFWTQRMSLMLQHLTGRLGAHVGAGLGVTAADMARCMKGIPVFPENLDLVRALGEREDVVQVIVSDANTLFIETYLEQMGLGGCFDAVYTNPVEWMSGRGLGDGGGDGGGDGSGDERGDERNGGEGKEGNTETITATAPTTTGRVLHVKPFVDPDRPHGCATCEKTPNMCKGAIVDLVRARFPATNAAAVVQKVVYLGDGRGDFCGACRLSRGDTILCRQGYALSKMLSETPPNALDVCVWDNGKDILRAFEERSLL